MKVLMHSLFEVERSYHHTIKKNKQVFFLIGVSQGFKEKINNKGHTHHTWFGYKSHRVIFITTTKLPESQKRFVAKSHPSVRKVDYA